MSVQRWYVDGAHAKTFHGCDGQWVLFADYESMEQQRDGVKIDLAQVCDQRDDLAAKIAALNAELAGYRRALKCANDYIAQRDPINGYAVFAVPFTPAEMAASQSETDSKHRPLNAEERATVEQYLADVTCAECHCPKAYHRPGCTQSEPETAGDASNGHTQTSEVKP